MPHLHVPARVLLAGDGHRGLGAISFQVEVARTIAPQYQTGCIQPDGLDSQKSLERLQLGQPHLQRIEGQQLLLRGVTDTDITRP